MVEKLMRTWNNPRKALIESKTPELSGAAHRNWMYGGGIGVSV